MSAYVQLGAPSSLDQSNDTDSSAKINSSIQEYSILAESIVVLPVVKIGDLVKLLKRRFSE